MDVTTLEEIEVLKEENESLKTENVSLSTENVALRQQLKQLSTRKPTGIPIKGSIEFVQLIHSIPCPYIGAWCSSSMPFYIYR